MNAIHEKSRSGKNRRGKSLAPGRGGFALPAAVFALALVGIMVTSGFFLAQQESRISVATEHGSSALYLAEEGLNQVRLDWDPPTYNAKDVWWDTLHTGTADGGNWMVTVTKTDSTNYFLESVGRVTTGGEMLSGATRRVGLLTRVVYPSITPPAALTTKGPTFVRGQASVEGTDEPLLGRDCPALDDKAGVLASDTSQVTSAGQGAITGDPQKEEDPTMNDPDDDTFTQFGEVSFDQLAAMATWTFPGSTVNPSPTLDANGNCDFSNPNNWGDPLNPTNPCGDYYPIIHFTGPASIQSSGSGQGILLVEGNLQIQGAFNFHGIVIVEGTLDTRGSGSTGPRIMGGVYAANADIESQGGAGASEIHTSTCAVQEAVRKSVKASRPLPLSERSWVDLSGTSY